MSVVFGSFFFSFLAQSRRWSIYHMNPGFFLSRGVSISIGTATVNECVCVCFCVCVLVTCKKVRVYM